VESVITLSGNGREVLQQYLMLQRACAARGLNVPRISDVYPRELLRKNELSDVEINRLDAAAARTQTRPFAMRLNHSGRTWTAATVMGEHVGSRSPHRMDFPRLARPL